MRASYLTTPHRTGGRRLLACATRTAALSRQRCCRRSLLATRPPARGRGQTPTFSQSLRSKRVKCAFRQWKALERVVTRAFQRARPQASFKSLLPSAVGTLLRSLCCASLRHRTSLHHSKPHASARPQRQEQREELFCSAAAVEDPNCCLITTQSDLDRFVAPNPPNSPEQPLDQPPPSPYTFI